MFSSSRLIGSEHMCAVGRERSRSGLKGESVLWVCKKALVLVLVLVLGIVVDVIVAAIKECAIILRRLPIELEILLTSSTSNFMATKAGVLSTIIDRMSCRSTVLQRLRGYSGNFTGRLLVII